MQYYCMGRGECQTNTYSCVYASKLNREGKQTGALTFGDPCYLTDSTLLGLGSAYDIQAVPGHSSGNSEEKGLFPTGGIDKAILI